uniref:Uncharacterized protein n=1 Tax=Cacopsylla melanoneura TaxID=428564 RepID=A0A8D8M1C6_9HEMI
MISAFEAVLKHPASRTATGIFAIEVVLNYAGTPLTATIKAIISPIEAITIISAFKNTLLHRASRTIKTINLSNEISAFEAVLKHSGILALEAVTMIPAFENNLPHPTSMIIKKVPVEDWHSSVKTCLFIFLFIDIKIVKIRLVEPEI